MNNTRCPSHEKHKLSLKVSVLDELGKRFVNPQEVLLQTDSYFIFVRPEIGHHSDGFIPHKLTVGVRDEKDVNHVT